MDIFTKVFIVINKFKTYVLNLRHSSKSEL